MTIEFEILPGLPPYGPMAQTFNGPVYKEGLVIAFKVPGKEDWVTNFHGHNTGFTKLLPHPDGRQIIVIAKGCGYVIDPSTRTATGNLSGGITYAEELPHLNAVLIGNFVGFEALRADGLWWKSRRIAWDGIQNRVINGNTLSGEAYSPNGDKWYPFKLDLLTGKCENAVYPAEIATAVPIKKS